MDDVLFLELSDGEAKMLCQAADIVIADLDIPRHLAAEGAFTAIKRLALHFSSSIAKILGAGSGTARSATLQAISRSLAMLNPKDEFRTSRTGLFALCRRRVPLAHGLNAGAAARMARTRCETRCRARAQAGIARDSAQGSIPGLARSHRGGARIARPARCASLPPSP